MNRLLLYIFRALEFWSFRALEALEFYRFRALEFQRFTALELKSYQYPTFEDLSYLMSASHVVETDGQEDEPDEGGEEPVADDP